MSFRLRVFFLVMLVAVTAIGATAWLTLSLASKQITDATAAGSRNTDLVAAALDRIAHDRGTWQGVERDVAALSGSNGVRIRLVALNGEVVADSDQQRPGRPTPRAPTLVDPRPALLIPDRIWPAGAEPAAGRPTGTDPASVKAERDLLNRTDRARGWVSGAITAYRHTVHLTACVWTGFQTSIPLVDGENGVPTAPTVPAPYTRCYDEASAETERTAADDFAAVDACPIDDGPTFGPCLQRVFTERVALIGPAPLQLFLGGVDDDPARLLGTPVLVAAGVVTLLALLGTALIARRVSRPIRSLTVASRRLTDGDLDARVDVDGNDELGRLSYSFNRMAEAIQHAEEDQRRLVASVAHELRTPLSNLRGYLEALQDGVVRPSPELFASLSEEVLLQRRILDDLQDLALAEAGGLAYRREPTDLAELVVVSCRAHRAVAEASGVTLTAHADTRLPVVVDRHRIRQVLGNLVTNAVRYTAAGGTVTLHAYASGGNAVVTVTDTGCGIAEGDLPHVFNRFWRADAARDRASGGSGLGLTIARQITLDHDGQLRVASRLGAGTTFTLTVPSRP